MDALQEITREIAAFLWKKRLNLSRQFMLAGPSRYGSLMLGKVVESPPLDSCLFSLSSVVELELPLRFVECAKLSLCYIPSADVIKQICRGKYKESVVPYCPPEKDHFVVLPCAACIENFIVCMRDLSQAGRIRYTSLLRFKELTVEDFDSRIPSSY